MSINFTGPMGIPDYIPMAIDLYVKEGVIPNDFLKAVLSNNLERAIAFADQEHIVALPKIVRYIYSKLPIGCRGSEHAVYEWVARTTVTQEIEVGDGRLGR